MTSGLGKVPGNSLRNNPGKQRLCECCHGDCVRSGFELKLLEDQQCSASRREKTAIRPSSNTHVCSSSRQSTKPPRSSSPLSSAHHAQHVEDEQGRAGLGDSEAWGGNGCEVTTPGAGTAPPVLAGGTGHRGDLDTEVRIPGEDDRDEQTRDQKERPGEVHGGGAGLQGEPEFHDDPTSQRGHPQDLPDDQGRWERSGGLRQVPQPHLQRGRDAASGVRRVGDDHLLGRAVLSSAREAGDMATTGSRHLDTAGEEGISQAQDGSSHYSTSSREHNDLGTRELVTGSERPDTAADRGRDPKSPSRSEVLEGGTEVGTTPPGEQGRRGDAGRGEELQRHLRASPGGEEEVNLGRMRTDAQATSLDATLSEGPVNQRLPTSLARHLEETAWAIVPNLFQDLSGSSRKVLMEVCCESDSVLAHTIQQDAGTEAAASRCSLWNACDVGTSSGVKLVLERIRLEKPQTVWCSPPCGPYSPIQNLNQRNKKQIEELQQKRLEARKIYVGCSIIAHYCIQQGIHFVWEMSEKCLAWRLPLLQRLRQKYSLFEAVTKGCSVNLREAPGEALLQKGWRILTTHARLASVMDMPCRCPKQYRHGRCEGRMTKASGLYTQEYAKRVSRVLRQELDHQTVAQECQGRTCLPEAFGEGAACVCEEVNVPNLPAQTCPCCLLGRDEVPGMGVKGGVFLSDSGHPVETPHGSQVVASGDPGGPRGPGMENKQGSEVEVAAKVALDGQDWSWETCLKILEGLGPRETSERGPSGSRTPKTYEFGYEGVTGDPKTYKDTTRRPQTVKYLNEFLRQCLPKQACWTSFRVERDVERPVQRDTDGKRVSLSYIVGLGNYTGGELLVGKPSSEQSQDTLAQAGSTTPSTTSVEWFREATWQQVVSFEPSSWHGVQGWEGNRWFLVAETQAGFEEVPNESVKELHQLGFPAFQMETGLVVRQPQIWKAKLKGRREQEDETIKKQIYLLHAATGHCSMRHLIQALKRRNAAPRVLELAKHFVCPVCSERKRVAPRHLASLEPLPPTWHTITADIGHWQHPVTHEHVQFMTVIDEGSRYRIARILNRGAKQQPSAATCLQYLREGWIQYFGSPKCLRLDPAGSFRSQAVQDFCDRQGVFLDIVPGEAHWQIGTCEQAIQGLKETMSRMCEDEPEALPEDLLSAAVRTFNQRDLIRGFSPLQLAFGRGADTSGSLIDTGHSMPDEFQVENPEGELPRLIQRQANAEKAHSEWQAQQRLSRARNSRSRPLYDYRPGQLVYFWRTQEAGKKSVGKGGRFLGPARVLATETRRDEAGELRPGSAVWIVRGRQLLKCAPEQLRHASSREELLEALSEDPKLPWTYTRVAEEIGGNQYQDISTERPTREEWYRAQDTTRETPPTRHRVRTKRPDPEAVDEEPETFGGSQPSRTQRPRLQEPQPQEVDIGICWWNTIPEQAWQQEESCFWNEEDAAVEVCIDMPESKRGMQKVLNNMEAFFTGALKKRAVEVCERRLNQQDREAFRQAKGIEIKNFLSAKAFEALPKELQPNKDQAIGMRWVLTWKLKPDGSSKAKARAVLLGYQDPAYEHRATAAPVMTRQSRQYLLHLAASKGWLVQKGDVSGAFLQGREYPGELYVAPCKEICEAMGIEEGSITRLKRACYGLVEAPLEWYRSVCSFLQGLGLERSWADPCLWMWRPQGHLRGIIAGHVDDFLFGGNLADEEWQKILQKVKERFQWSDWEQGSFVQCGVHITQTKEGFEMSQRQYVEDHIVEIPISASRRKDRHAETSEREKTALRATLGALSWHAQQVAPHVAADTSLLLSEITKSTVETIIKVNLLVQHTRARKDYTMKIHAFGDEELCLYAWVDAASQNRPDGGSTQGIYVGIGPLNMQQGAVGCITPICWHSSKIDRACRSPGAAETQAAVNGEDALFYARYQLAELTKGPVDTRNPSAMVSLIPGCVITDSRNVFDKLNAETLSIKGAEKKSNIELIGLKESQEQTGLVLRWVHSEAQLANSLTKSSGSKELELYYKMGQRWRIIEDPAMMSARRRKAAGLDPMASTPPTSLDSNRSSSPKHTQNERQHTSQEV